MNETAESLVRAINQLPKNQYFDYPNERTKTKICISHVTLPEGPVSIKRYTPPSGVDPKGAFSPATAKEATISVSMFSRVAAAVSEGLPLNIDRILGASYNTRSALEALLVRTPQFHICYPGRIEGNGESFVSKKGHKHFIHLPNSPHPLGSLSTKDVDLTISELPSAVSIYEAIDIPTTLLAGGLDIDTARRHIQIQIALIHIGRHLGFRTYLAKNDQGISYNGDPIANLPSVVTDLNKENIVSAFSGAVNAAKLIDCVWFKNGKLMPAVLEVEHSTGVTSGLTRMKHFQDSMPAIPTRWTVVAPDKLRDKVMRESNKPQFRSLEVKYFSYSAVEELYSLCQRRKIRGVTEEFLDCFMEPTIRN